MTKLFIEIKYYHIQDEIAVNSKLPQNVYKFLYVCGIQITNHNFTIGICNKC